MRAATMHRAAVVPDYESTDPPFIAVDELGPGRVQREVVEQEPAFRYGPADNVRSVRREVQRLALRTGMAPHQALPGRWIFLPFAGQEVGEADLSARPENIMLGDEPADLVLHRLRQGIIGGGHISEFGLATAERAGWRHRDGIEHSEHDRDGHVRSIRMPKPVAEAVETPAILALAQSALFVQVRDVSDLRQRESPLAGLGSRPPDFERAEIRGEVPQLLVVETLITEHQHGVPVDRFPDRADSRRIARRAEINAADLGGEKRMDVPNFRAHALTSKRLMKMRPEANPHKHGG